MRVVSTLGNARGACLPCTLLAGLPRSLLAFERMLKPIKRIFVPKHLALQPLDAAVTPPVAPVMPLVPAAPVVPAVKHNALFDELPQPDMEEKNSDSIWAAFDSVLPIDIGHK